MSAVEDCEVQDVLGPSNIPSVDEMRGEINEAKIPEVDAVRAEGEQSDGGERKDDPQALDTEGSKRRNRSRSTSCKVQRLASSRSRSTDRRRAKKSSRSHSRDGHKDSGSRKKHHSRSRDTGRRHRSRSRDRNSRRKSSRSHSRTRQGRATQGRDSHDARDYKPRVTHQPFSTSDIPQRTPPFGAPFVSAFGTGMVAPSAPAPHDPLAMQRLLQEQQLRSQQLILQQQILSNGQANSAKNQKEARAARRVYVGNLQPHMVTEDQLKAIFNSALNAAFPASQVLGMEPVVAINRQAEGRYAFVELRTPEMATAAMQLTGQVTLHGKAMTVERPQDYVDPQKQAQAAQMAYMALASLHQPSAMMPGMGLPGPP